MSEDAPPPADPPPADPPADPPVDDKDKDWKAEHEKTLAEARKWEDRAKANREAAKELEKLKREGMSDLEKKIAEARDEARAEALKEHATELVDARMEAAASGRIDAKKLADLLEPIDRTKFLTEDGRVDVAKVTKFIEAVAPKQGPADLGQGPRGDPAPADFNGAIRARMRR